MTSFHEEEFSVQFRSLTPEAQDSLRRTLAGFEIVSRDPSVAVVIVKEQDLQPICDFVKRNHIASDSYSVWVSLVTSSDHDGVRVPRRVVELIRATDGGVDFSFASLAGEVS